LVVAVDLRNEEGNERWEIRSKIEARMKRGREIEAHHARLRLSPISQLFHLLPNTQFLKDPKATRLKSYGSSDLPKIIQRSALGFTEGGAKRDGKEGLNGFNEPELLRSFEDVYFHSFYPTKSEIRCGSRYATSDDGYP